MTRLREHVQLLNMLMIEKDGKVLVLDKVKKQGWEGLTFPGGKVEKGETLAQSVRREAREETGLSIGRVSFCGFIQWVVKEEDLRMTGLLYKTSDFTGELQESAEGPLQWMTLEELKAHPGKSDSMAEIIQVYEGLMQEIYAEYDKEKLTDLRFE